MVFEFNNRLTLEKAMKLLIDFQLMTAGSKSAEIMRKVFAVLCQRIADQTSPMFQVVSVMVTDDSLIADYYDRDHSLTTHNFPVTILVSRCPFKPHGNIVVSTPENIGNCLNSALDGCLGCLNRASDRRMLSTA